MFLSTPFPWYRRGYSRARTREYFSSPVDDNRTDICYYVPPSATPVLHSLNYVERPNSIYVDEEGEEVIICVCEDGSEMAGVSSHGHDVLIICSATGRLKHRINCRVPVLCDQDVDSRPVAMSDPDSLGMLYILHEWTKVLEIVW